MGKGTRFCNGYGIITNRHGEKQINANYSIDSRVKEGILNAYVNDVRHPMYQQFKMGVSPLFNRYNNKRYESSAVKCNLTRAIRQRNSTYETIWDIFSATLANNTNMIYGSNSSVATSDMELAIGSHHASWQPSGYTPWSVGVPPFFPDSVYYSALITSVDVSSTEIGPVYKHQDGYHNRLFNDAGDSPSSQGDYIISGTYDPPEGFEGHMSFDVYMVESGGTGSSTGTSGTDGSTTAPADFSSSGYTFVSGDVNKFIKITDGKTGADKGTYKITSVSTGVATTDASTINQAFTTYAGGDIEWEMVEGPIGEYFYRAKPYSHGDWAGANFDGTYSSYLPLQCIGHEIGGVTATAKYHMMVRQIYDRGGNWWFIVRHPTDNGDYCLLRWCHMSPSGLDTTYKNGDIGGSMPTGAIDWADICQDDNDDVWCACAGGTSNTQRIFKIDPYPGSPPDASSPTMSAAYGKQSNIYTGDGVTSGKIGGLVADDSQAYAAGTRIWVFTEDDGGTEDAGGISYTDDYGTTWKRLHVLHTISGETLTVSNGSPNVTGGTSLDTKVAVGDWVRFGSDTRSYEVDARTATTMTLAENYQGTGGSYSVQKGALASTEAEICRVGDFATDSASVDKPHSPPCDYDSDGNVYWVPSGRDRVCKWNEGTGQVTVATTQSGGDLSNPYRFDNPTTLKVTRMPTVGGGGSSIYDDNIWIGGNDTTYGGWSRVTKENFDVVNNNASITAFADAGGGQVTVTSNSHGLSNNCLIEITGTTNYNGFYYISNVLTNTFEITATWVSTETGTWRAISTRYNWNTTTNFPKTVDLAYDANGCKSGWNVLFASGEIHLIHNSNSGVNTYIDRYFISSGNTGTIFSGRYTVGCTASANNDLTQTPPRTLGNISMDDIGLGYCAFMPFGHHDQDGPYSDTAGLYAPFWICRVWDGSSWEVGKVSSHTNIDFNGTPNCVSAPTPGNGSKRVHEWDEELFGGVNIRFEQAGGATAQADEYIQDEGCSCTCYYGVGKDNLATASWQSECHATPTVFRLDEPVKALQNMWTSDGGIDGGYKTSGASGDFVTFSRGPAENQMTRGQGYSPYWTTSSWTEGSPDYLQLVAALRIKDESENNDTNATIAPGSDLSQFQDTDETFTSADVGKSIIIEASTASNGGQYVITSVVGGSGNTVEVEPDFTANESGTGFRWKLRDIPAVAYVGFNVMYNNNSMTGLAVGHDFYLYSSDDYGATWTERKHMQDIYAKSVNDDLDQDNGFMDCNELGQWSAYDSNPNSATQSFSVIFRLTDLIAANEHSTRRQYWKVIKDRIHTSNQQMDVAGIILYDESFNILGRPSVAKIEDADDSLFSACFESRPMMVPYESTTAGSPTDDGDGNDWTDIVDASSETFWEADETAGAITGGNTFADTAWTGAFTSKDVGKFIRINESGYADNGMYAISSVTDADTVVLSATGLTNQSNLDWQLVAFGPEDYVRFESSTLYSRKQGADLEDTYYEIADVPSTTRIELASAELPLTINGSSWSANFDINRDFADVKAHTQQSGFDTGNMCAVERRSGSVFYSTAVEFVEIQSGTTATTKEWGGSATDNDGDGRVNAVDVGTTVDSEVAAGDYALLYGSSSYGRRVLEIEAISGNDLKFYYDELLPSDTFTNWVIYTRRTWLKAANRRQIVILNETP